jgi:hypothetical protein
MNVEQSTTTQVLVAWRANKWIVSRNTVELGAYAYRPHAIDAARKVAREAAALGLPCYILIREADGRWEERPCPKPLRPGRT